LKFTRCGGRFRHGFSGSDEFTVGDSARITRFMPKDSAFGAFHREKVSSADVSAQNVKCEDATPFLHGPHFLHAHFRICRGSRAALILCRMKLRLVVERDPETKRWAAFFPELPGCASAGDTEDEAVRNAKEALELWINSSS